MIYFISKNGCRMRTRVHIGIQKKAGNIPILSRCVGTTPTHLKRPIGINNDSIVHGVVAASSRRSTIYPARRFLVHFFMYEEFLVNRKVPFLISRSYRIFSITLVPYLVMYISSYSIRIVLLSRYVNIYDTMAPMSLSPMNEHSSYT